MTEDEAIHAVRDRVSDQALVKLERLAGLVRAGSQCQNLVASSTLNGMWSRHVLDSAQLLDHASDRSGHWVDIGTGAGFPGLVIACVGEHRVSMLEPRRRRANFLRECVVALGLEKIASTVEAAAETAGIRTANIISARAVAPLAKLLLISRGFFDPSTRFILPSGRAAAGQIEAARAKWQGSFHVEQSVTDATSFIIVADEVRPR